MLRTPIALSRLGFGLLASPIAAPSMVLSVAPSGRYLQNTQGTPVRIKADAGWFAANHAGVTNQNTYLDGIKALGFNATVLMNIVHGDPQSWTPVNEPNNIDGDAPFTGKALATPSDTYFNKVSDYVTRAGQRGIWVMLFHTYLGYQSGDDGWTTEIAALTSGEATSWGQYLANKFTQDNIIWMHGGDETMGVGTVRTRYQSIVAGIQSVTRNRLSSAEWAPSDTHVTDQAGFTYGTNPATSDMQIDWYYGDIETTYPEADQAWRAGTTLPAALGEPNYYNFGSQTYTSRDQVRRAQHWSFTAGAIAGSNFGHTNRWDWVPASWEATLSNAATLDQSYRHALYDSLKWWLFRPSGTASTSPHGGSGYSGYCGRDLIVSNIGSGTSLITSCMTSDGEQLLAYVPPTGTSGRTFSVDLRSMAGTSRARWWNPTSGAFTFINTYANSLSAQSFTTPGNNGTGTNDWMLVLDPA